MAERRWTKEQLSAIETRDRTLLVSAAAGSGKTATLTERIIRSLTDEKNPVDIDSLLVVTFTNAAARELRAKIAKALTEAVEANPDDKRLERQLYMLPSARIRTIDSFCNEILRQNSDRAGISPNYRIADTAECELLATSILEGLIEAVYNGELPDIASPEEFEELADCLTDSKRTEDLAGVFRFIHLRCDSAEDGVDSLLPLVDNYSTFESVENSVYGEYIIARYREMLDHYISVVDRYIRIFQSGNSAEEKYLVMAESDRELLLRLRDANSYDAMRSRLLDYEFMKKPTVKKDRTDDMETYSAVRDMLKDDLTDIKGYFSYTSDMWRALFESLYKLLSVLYRFEKRFDIVFTEEKRRRSAFSYADIERYTYNCLIKDGEPTDIAINLRNQFSAIYIDEYQDVNALQNRIFEVIAKPDNRFMVGDIKQSIYGFRSACPEIFADMKASSPRLCDEYSECASIFMSSNFRCDRAIVDFVNGIFDRAFSLIGESIGYTDADRLGYAKIHDSGEPEYITPEICLLDKHKADDEDAIKAPDVVAAKIKELLDSGTLDNGEKIRPSDIAIILRNAKGKDSLYAEALERAGIPSCISGAKDFFLSSEVLLVLCLLNSIDNPRRDIYLAGLMCSPLFDFTADELYLVSRGEHETLYESLVAYVADNPEFLKGKHFLDTLNYYRTIAEGIGVDRLIYKLYHETGLLSLAARNGGKENLMLLYDYARSYESGAFRGLYNFISFINNLIDKKTTFDDAREISGEDAVRIVTCHASKGLEYPVVFLVETGARLSNKDSRSRLAFAEGFGISFRLRTPSGLAVVNNPVQDIINHRVYRKLYEEELRVLYVALTRARERLFIIGDALLDDREKYEQKLSVIKENLSEYTMRSLASYMEISLVCSGADPKSVEDFVHLGEISDAEAQATAEEEARTFTENASLTELLKERFAYEYPSPHMTVLPEKMSVSRTSPTVLDGTESEAVSIEKADAEENKRRLPRFADGSLADESAKRGIATHYFMQFFDLSELERVGAERELSRLVNKGFISKEDEGRVRIREIEMFLHSDLFLEMKNARRIFREFRFNLPFPADSFTADEEKIAAYKDETILVQGVIDCIIEREDGSIGLYDYKTDRLTREELSDRSLAEARLREKHSEQLKLYAVAVEKIFGKAPQKIAVYSLPLGDTVDIK